MKTKLFLPQLIECREWIGCRHVFNYWNWFYRNYLYSFKLLSLWFFFVVNEWAYTYLHLGEFRRHVEICFYLLDNWPVMYLVHSGKKKRIDNSVISWKLMQGLNNESDVIICGSRLRWRFPFRQDKPCPSKTVFHKNLF